MDAYFPIASTSMSSLAHLRRLELELSFCQTMLNLVLDHLHRTMNPIDQDSPLGRAFGADDPTRAERIVDQIEFHLASNREDLALRLIHDETTIIWDDLYAMIRDWKNLSVEDKRRFIRYARWKKAIQFITKNPH